MTVKVVNIISLYTAFSLKQSSLNVGYTYTCCPRFSMICMFDHLILIYSLMHLEKNKHL